MESFLQKNIIYTNLFFFSVQPFWEDKQVVC